MQLSGSKRSSRSGRRSTTPTERPGSAAKPTTNARFAHASPVLRVQSSFPPEFWVMPPRRARAPWSFRELLAVVGLAVLVAIVVIIVGAIAAAALPAAVVDDLDSDTTQVVAIGSAFYLSLGAATWLLIVRR